MRCEGFENGLVVSKAASSTKAPVKIAMHSFYLKFCKRLSTSTSNMSYMHRISGTSGSIESYY